MFRFLYPVSLWFAFVLWSFDHRSSKAFSLSASNGCRLQHIVCPYREQDLLNSFYALHFSKPNKQVLPPPPKPDDQVYILVEGKDDTVVAVVRLCPSKQDNYVLLRSLCVSRAHRRQGLALKLIQEAIDDYSKRFVDTDACYCFADKSLEKLYEQAHFELVQHQTEVTPDWMWRSFQVVSRRLKRKHQHIKLFVQRRGKNSTATTASSCDKVLCVILLQHCCEMTRPTSTAPLVVRNTNKSDETDLQRRLNVTVWSWSGRADNLIIEQQLEKLAVLQGGNSPILLWTGGNRTVTTESTNSSYSNITSFIILDGTWQEARTMFRKLPVLQTLPRFSIASPTKSNFTLRKDYTGWKERFRDNNITLLCTAEVVAALLDAHGDVRGGEILRMRLQEFQHNHGKQ